MKNIKLFIMASSMIVFVSCSTTYTESIDEETTLESETRGKTSQNDSTEEGGVSASKNPWIVVSDSIVVTETPNYENERDSVPSDTIPNDSTKYEKAFNTIKTK